MKYRTWDEIENSKEEYEQKAMSYYNWLIENRITVNNNEDLKSYIEKTEAYYAQVYSKESGFTTDDLNNYENGLEQTKRQLDECISNDISGRNRNYNVTAFLSYYAKMRQLEAMVRKSKTILDKQEKVRELFGDFSAVNNKVVKKQTIRTNKTSQELIDERNSRLAILNDLHHEGTITKKEFLDYVVAVNDSYNDEIKISIDKEVKNVEKEPTKMEKVLKKVKNFFHIGKPVEEVQSQDLLDAKKIVNNLNAQNALHDASELVSGEKKNALFHSMIDIIHQTPVVSNPEVSSLINEMFDKKRELAKARYKGDEEMLQATLKYDFRKRTSMMSPLRNNHGVYEVKSKADLQDEKMQVVNFLLEKYKHEQDMSISPDGNIVLNGYKFEDAKAQSLYKEIEKVYATLEVQRENCVVFEKTRKNMTQNIIDKMAGSSVTV